MRAQVDPFPVHADHEVVELDDAPCRSRRTDAADQLELHAGAASYEVSRAPAVR
jgi:hypothetical protein